MGREHKIVDQHWLSTLGNERVVDILLVSGDDEVLPEWWEKVSNLVSLRGNGLLRVGMDARKGRAWTEMAKEMASGAQGHGGFNAVRVPFRTIAVKVINVKYVVYCSNLIKMRRHTPNRTNHKISPVDCQSHDNFGTILRQMASLAPLATPRTSSRFQYHLLPQTWSQQGDPFGSS